MESANVQKTIDFNRGAQLRILERATLPELPPEKRTKKVRNWGTLKNILKAIESYQRTNASCYPSMNTLATNTGLSRRTIQRGLHQLDALGLVSITPARRPNGSTATHTIEIEWVRLLDSYSDESADAAVPQVGPIQAPRAPSGGGDNLTRGGDMLSRGGCQDGTPSKRTSNRPLKRKEHVAREEKGFRSQESGVRGSKTSKTFWGREQPLTRRDLTNGATVAGLFRFAVAKGWGGLQATEPDELTFFGLCAFCARKANDPSNCGRYLTYLLKEKLYGNICDQDDQAAQRMLTVMRNAEFEIRSDQANQLATAFALPVDNNPPDRRAELERRAQLERSTRPWV